MGSLASAGVRGIVLAGVIAAALGTLVVSGSLSRTDAATTSMYITPASQTVNQNTGEVTVEIGVNDVAGMASWEFILDFDPGVLEFVSGTVDSSFVSGGGSAACWQPQLDPETEARIWVGCATTVPLDAPGVSGSGRFATLVFEPKAAGTSPLVFTKISISTAFPEDIPAFPVTGVIRVLGSGESKPSEPVATPTVDYALLTPTPVSGVVVPEPIDPVDPNTGVVGRAGAGNSGSGRSGVAGVRAGASRSGSGANANADANADEDFPVAGYGPQQSGSPGWPRDLGIALAVLGAVTTVGGVRVARRNAARAGERKA